MFANHFNVNGREISFEGYGSTDELIQKLHERKAREFSDASIYDYVNKSEDAYISSPDWRCFKNPKELKDLIEFGIADAKLMDEVEKFKAATATRTQIARCKPKNAMAGGCVNIGRYLNGSPDCFRSKERMPAPSKVRYIAVDAGIMGDIQPRQVQRIGKLIVGAIMATEIRGDRVRLDVCTATMCHKNRVMMLAVNAKKETDRMDLARFMFWCASPAVNRGVSFNWRATHPDFPPEDYAGMGRSIGYSNMALAKEIYKEVFPDGTIVLNIMNLILQTNGMSDDEAVDYIKELMME